MLSQAYFGIWVGIPQKFWSSDTHVRAHISLATIVVLLSAGTPRNRRMHMIDLSTSLVGLHWLSFPGLCCLQQVRSRVHSRRSRLSVGEALCQLSSPLLCDHAFFVVKHPHFSQGTINSHGQPMAKTGNVCPQKNILPPPKEDALQEH